MKTHRTTDHLAKGAAALLALLMSFGSFAAAASALQPEPLEPPTAPGIEDFVGPDICDLIDCGVTPPGDDEDEGEEEPDDDGEEEPDDDGEGEEEPGDEDEDEPEEEEEEPEVEDEDEDEENIDTPVEATPTFTG